MRAKEFLPQDTIPRIMYQAEDEVSYEEKVNQFIHKITAVANNNRVRIELQPWTNDIGQTIGVEITDLYADTPGSGGGTKVMQAVENLADDLTLSVYPAPESSRNRNEFYPRFGFVNDKRRPKFMVRFPKFDDIDEEAIL